MIALFVYLYSKLLGGIRVYYYVGAYLVLLCSSGVAISFFVYKYCVHNLFLVECEFGHGACSFIMADRKEMTCSINDVGYGFRSCTIVDLVWVDTVVILLQVTSELFF